MRIQENVIAALLAAPAVTALVDQRIYWLQPQPQAANSQRFIALRLAGFERQGGGGLASAADQRVFQIEVACHSKVSIENAWDVADAVAAALEGFDKDLGGITLAEVTLESAQDVISQDAMEKGYWAVAMTFNLYS